MERSEDLSVAIANLGVAACATGLVSIVGPTPASLVLDGDATKLLLRDRQEPIQEFDDIGDLAPPGWLNAARAKRRCLLVVGEMIGLDRPSQARLDVLLADGRAVAAVTVAKIRRKYQLRSKSSRPPCPWRLPLKRVQGRGRLASMRRLDE